MPREQRTIKKVLKINKKHYGDEHPETGKTLRSLGHALGTLGNYVKGKELLDRALEIMKKYYGKDQTETGMTLEKLGMVYAGLDKQEEALKCYQQAYTILANCNMPEASRVKELMDKLDSNSIQSFTNLEKKKE